MEAAFTKISALVINDEGKLLVVRGKGDDFYKAFGGKVEGSETDLECLRREIREEGMVEMESAQLYLEPPLTPVENKPGVFFNVRFYLVKLAGTPIANPEDNTEELRWISGDEFLRGDLKIASALRIHAIPKLIDDRLMKLKTTRS